MLRRTTLYFTSKITLFSLPKLHLSTLSPSSSPFYQNPTKILSQSDIKNLVLSQYHHGKFHNLLQNVVALPSFLLTACHNLKPNDKNTLTLDFVSTHFFSLQELSYHLSTNQFDVKVCGFTIPPSSVKGKPLVFDKEIQELRLKTSRENPRVDANDFAEGYQGNAFYKPLKIYAVRCLDEILVITSGTKMMTLDLKSRLVQILERDMEFGIDKVKTVIHSATSEKIEFLGMELQAVKPSVLHPPMSQKAIRARKKYLRQKEVRALELRNAKESNRKKLGMKIFSHVFKKMKRANGFKTDFQIESEVNQIFDSWAEEVMQDFLESVDDRWEWHRMLSSGDFLSLKRIRDQLPRELVDAYDNFQEQVDRYINPIKAKRMLEEQAKIAEEEEERKYSDQTVADLTKLCIKVEAPLEIVKKAVKLIGFTNHMGRPRPISLLMVLEDADIIKWYAGIGRRWLDFFCCCHNFRKLKIIVSYHLRFSCILTLAEKHESSKKEAIRHYTKDLKVSNVDGVEKMYFPTEREVKMMGDNVLIDPNPVDGSLGMTLIRLASDEPSYCCAAHFCDRRDTIVYRIRLLQNVLNLDPWVPGMGAIHENLNKRCIPLCSDHISELYLGRLTLQDTDFASLLHVD
uniref:Domain X domain-containing protein n=1 Tax=Solanum lycopersicum TaxID=4081 RepID=K4BFM4_SOLLC